MKAGKACRALQASLEADQCISAVPPLETSSVPEAAEVILHSRESAGRVLRSRRREMTEENTPVGGVGQDHAWIRPPRITVVIT